MAYNSSVGIVFSEEHFKAALAKESDVTKSLIQDLLDGADTHEELEGAHLYKWDGIKWYVDTYTAVQWLEAYWRNNEEEVQFIRIGEYNDDLDISVQNKNGLPFQLKFKRSIDW